MNNRAGRREAVLWVLASGRGQGGLASRTLARETTCPAWGHSNLPPGQSSCQQDDIILPCAPRSRASGQGVWVQVAGPPVLGVTLLNSVTAFPLGREIKRKYTKHGAPEEAR